MKVSLAGVFRGSHLNGIVTVSAESSHGLSIEEAAFGLVSLARETPLRSL
jgi:hypothetical protein